MIVFKKKGIVEYYEVINYDQGLFFMPITLVEFFVCNDRFYFGTVNRISEAGPNLYAGIPPF